MGTPVLPRHIREAARAVRNHKYEVTPEGGIFVPSMGVFSGVFSIDVCGDEIDLANNMIPEQGRNHILDTIFGAPGQVLTWYVSLFTNNATPQDNWTAANYHANAAEFTGYSEGSRPSFVRAPASGGSISNGASKATFTITSSATLYGAAVLSNPAKYPNAGYNTGLLLAAARFTNPRGLEPPDSVGAQYTLTLTNA